MVRTAFDRHTTKMSYGFIYAISSFFNNGNKLQDRLSSVLDTLKSIYSPKALSDEKHVRFLPTLRQKSLAILTACSETLVARICVGEIFFVLWLPFSLQR